MERRVRPAGRGRHMVHQRTQCQRQEFLCDAVRQDALRNRQRTVCVLGGRCGAVDAKTARPVQDDRGARLVPHHHDGDIKALEERLAKPKSAKFIIVDSYQYAYEAGWEYSLTRALIDRFKRKTFIFVSQEDKGKPMGKPAIRLKYAAGVKVRTQGFRAYCQGRYSGNVSEYYTIWAEKAVEVYNDKSNN